MKTIFKYIRVLIICAGMAFISCNDDDDVSGELTFNAPELSIDGEDSGAFRVGQTIRVTVEYEASALFREFVVQRGSTLVERISYPERTEGEDDYTLDFLITDDLLGTTQTFTFTITDSLGESESATFTATISEVEPAFAFEDVEINGTIFRQVTGRINFDETFDKDHLWLLNGNVQVDDITTLTIEAGTTVYANDESSKLSVLVGGTLNAEGSLEEPIQFTTLNAAPGQSGETNAEDWIGLEINGNPEVPNSGILQFVRIEYAGGFDPDDDEDVEALRLTGVGEQTVVDYVQVHESGDSGIRIRGGDVNLKHLFVTKPGDRGIRYSSGWQGNGQFWVVLTDNDSRAVNGRDATGDDAPPIPSNGTISNVTLIGPNILGSGADGNGVRIRDGAKGEFHNFIVTGFSNSFRNQSDGGDMIIKNSAVFGNGNDGDDDGLHSSIDDEYLDPANENSVDEVPLTDTFIGVSTLNSSNASTLGSFFDDVNFVGAVSPDDDWTLGWTLNFDGTPRE